MLSAMPPLDGFLLGLGGALLGVAILTLSGVAWSQARRITTLATALAAQCKAGEQVTRDLAALVGCSRELGERLGQHSAKQKAVVERLNEMAQQMDGGLAITQAERLLASGLEMDQISQICALSQGEAALLERWKQQRSAA
ncbi:MAG: DUF2802 domain-containing protein [Gammaproteobacteria bacterium]|nr:DUF2802 domain-containing protein [Gammaproteobacteria bacterium]